MARRNPRPRILRTALGPGEAGWGRAPVQNRVARPHAARIRCDWHARGPFRCRNVRAPTHSVRWPGSSISRECPDRGERDPSEVMQGHFRHSGRLRAPRAPAKPGNERAPGRAGLTGRARARSKDLPVRAPGKRPLRDGESGRSALGGASTRVAAACGASDADPRRTPWPAAPRAR